MQSGAWTLSPYQGPAIQPYLHFDLGDFAFEIAPAASWRSRAATAADGREGTLRVKQWRLEGRVHWQYEPIRLGIDGGWSSGHAEINGESVASPTQQVHISPSIGFDQALTEDVALIGRVLWPIFLTEEQLSHGPRAAIAIEWGL